MPDVWPTAVLVNTTGIVQLAPENPTVQVPPLCENTVEDRVMAAMLAIPGALFVTVTVCATVGFWTEPEKESEPGVRLKADRTPVPLNATVRLPALFATVNVSLLCPVACGLKTTCTSHCARDARDKGQLLL